MLKSILVGAMLTIGTVAIHALGTTWWIQRLQRDRGSLENSSNWGLQVRWLGSTAVVLLLLHMVEVTVWAIAYLAIPTLDEIATFEEATYFSTVTFTTLGYGDVVIGRPWRMLAAVQAMTGLLIFGWSTGLFISVVQRLWMRMKVE